MSQSDATRWLRVRAPASPAQSCIGGEVRKGGEAPLRVLADVVPTFGSVNMIGGELDR